MLSPQYLALLAVLLAALGLLLDIALQLRGIRDQIGKLSRKITRSVSDGSLHIHPLLRKFTLPVSIWCFEGDAWILLSHCGRPGCDCGPAPSGRGTYEGQVVRKECGTP